MVRPVYLKESPSISLTLFENVVFFCCCFVLFFAFFHYFVVSLFCYVPRACACPPVCLRMRLCAAYVRSTCITADCDWVCVCVVHECAFFCVCVCVRRACAMYIIYIYIYIYSGWICVHDTVQRSAALCGISYVINIIACCSSHLYVLDRISTLTLSIQCGIYEFAFVCVYCVRWCVF